MGFKDRLEKANEAARQARAEGVEERREQRDKLKADWPSREQPKISEAGATDEGLRCPNCGGQQFIAKRSKGGKAVGALFGGIGVAAAPKSRVRCVTCGETFKRG
jgi:DNA-directed RNA polymerase subunit RPC12/RpoP